MGVDHRDPMVIIPCMAHGSKKVLYAALLGNTGIAITKFVAAAMTQSSAMLAEAIHSCVDTGNQVLLLWGLKQAKRPPDAERPLGYGKEVYFWSFVVAILIFAVGAGVSIYEGIVHLTASPRADAHAGSTSLVVNYVVLVIAMIFEGSAWWIARREFRAAKGDRGYLEAVHVAKDPTMFVVLLEDSAALLGLLAAFVGITLTRWTGSAVFDGAASIVIGLILGGVACWLAWESKSLLIGEAADPEVQKQIRTILSEHAGIKSVNELITLHMGPQSILVNVSVDFADHLTSREVEDAVADFNRNIKKALPEVQRIFIEAETYAAHRLQQRSEDAKPDGGAHD